MRIIDADDLKVHISELMLVYSGTELDNAILNAIDNAPTVKLFCAYLSDGEVRQPCLEAPCKHERPQGEWNYIQADMCVCPFCGAMPHKLYKNYCAKCGAKMQKGGAEE